MSFGVWRTSDYIIYVPSFMGILKLLCRQSEKVYCCCYQLRRDKICTSEFNSGSVTYMANIRTFSLGIALILNKLSQHYLRLRRGIYRTWHREGCSGSLCVCVYLHYVRFEVLTAVTMKNAVFWDIMIQFVPQRGQITSPLQSPTG
jgi:hypothetical protein